MALNAADARAMAAAAHELGRLLCISHNFLFSRSARRAEAILGGARPSYVFGMQLSSPRRRLPVWCDDLPGGLMTDESPHLLYMLSHYLGDPLRLVTARGTVRRGSPSHETVELLLEGARGLGQITMCFGAPVSEWHVGVVTPGRVVLLDLFRDIVTSLGPDDGHKAMDIARTSAKAIADHTVGFAASGASLVRRRQFWGHDTLMARFVDACLGRGPAPVDPAGAVAVVELMEDILAALEAQ
jgi:scyllo-inositol 2-dehydrogenase (NADP+)